MDVSSYTAFQLRLQWLEAILDNPQTTVRQSALITPDSSQSTADEPKAVETGNSDAHPTKDITQRTGDLAQRLRSALLETGHDSLRRLIDEYESLAGVLFPYDATSTTDSPIAPSTGTTKDTRKDTTPKPPLIKASDLIPTDTKVELVLGAEEDIRDAERILREIQVLVERGADGSGDLASYEPLQERLQALHRTHSGRMASQRRIQEKVIDTLGRYDDYVTSMSRMFVDLHSQVTEMEEQVGRLERRKRERDAMTY